MNELTKKEFKLFMINTEGQNPGEEHEWGEYTGTDLISLFKDGNCVSQLYDTEYISRIEIKMYGEWKQYKKFDGPNKMNTSKTTSLVA